MMRDGIDPAEGRKKAPGETGLSNSARPALPWRRDLEALET